MNKSVTILGLGLMGGNMAARLLGGGFAVTVWNRSVEKTEPLRTQGACVKSSPREAVAGASVVISMLADDEASRAVWLGKDGALEGVNPGTVLLESSTVTVDWVRELAALAAKNQCEFLDAPVTGSKPQAAAGQLVFLVGGSESVLERVKPVLAPMSKDVVHLGPTGSGAMMKLVNNFISGIQGAALAEGIAALEKAGMNVARSVEVLTNGAPGSPMVKTLAARMMAKDYAPNFMLRLLAKDMRYAIQQIGAGDAMEVAAAALKTMERAIESGHGEQDMSSMIEAVRQK